MERDRYMQELYSQNEVELYEVSSRENNAKIIFATNDYFGVAENLLEIKEPVKQEGFTKFGKCVDGWETQSRHTNEGPDFAIIKLAVEVKIFFICLDTAFFINNFPLQFSIQGDRKEILDYTSQERIDRLGKSATKEEMQLINKMQSENWPHLITRTNLEPGYPSMSTKFFRIGYNQSITHVRLNIFPSGGIARLRIYGKTVHSFHHQLDFLQFDLISKIHSGRCVSYSSSYSGHPNNLLKPAESINAADGWETVKNIANIQLNSRTTKIDIIANIMNEEWARFRLRYIGKVNYVIIDTSHFKGNAPNFVRVEGLLHSSMERWLTIVPLTKVIEGTKQFISATENKEELITEIKLIFIPCGGINRFRVFGRYEFYGK